jgi:hypothetical protein
MVVTRHHPPAQQQQTDAGAAETNHRIAVGGAAGVVSVQFGSRRDEATHDLRPPYGVLFD